MSGQLATLYEEVADRVQAMIEEGTLRPGDRIPSVRRLHGQWSVSISTVLEAYRLLEDRGLIEARPRSGYFVRTSPLRLVEEPTASDPPPGPQQVRTDLVMRLHAEINEPDVVRLGAAAPDMDLLPGRVLARKVTQVMRRHPHASHTYMAGPGDEGLRRQIARRMVDAGCAVGPGDVVVTSGAQEALFLSLRAVTEPGDMVAVESPCYFGLLEIIETLHLRALELRTHPRDGLDLDTLEDALRDGGVAACAVVASHSNPLGSCMDDDRKRRLAELAAHYRVPVIEDDIYGDLSFEGSRPRALKAFDRDGWVLYCSSFSKTISPGMRIGWSVAGPWRQEVMLLKNLTSIAAPSVSQLAIAAYLADGGHDRHLRLLRRTYRENLARAIDAIGRHFPAGTRATRPTGGQLLWVEMPREVSAVQLYEDVRPHRISVAPGVLFSAAGRYAHCLRLNLGLAYDERVDAALRTLGRLAKAQLS
jgi:DNA-binding transcriptional MocR family regulator